MGIECRRLREERGRSTRIDPIADAGQWGAQPKEISHNSYWWGLTEEGEWTYQPLGQEWTAT